MVAGSHVNRRRNVSLDEGKTAPARNFFNVTFLAEGETVARREQPENEQQAEGFAGCDDWRLHKKSRFILASRRETHRCNAAAPADTTCRRNSATGLSAPACSTAPRQTAAPAAGWRRDWPRRS